MTTPKAWIEQIEDYLDDQTWWQRTFWPIWRLWDSSKPRTLYMEAKYFIQRGRRGYSDRDLWNLNDHIAVQVLAYLDTERYGLNFSDYYTKDPSEDSEDAYKKAQSSHEKTEAEIRWLMEEHLNLFNDGGAIQAGRWMDPKYRKRIERANRLFGKYWMSLWD